MVKLEEVQDEVYERRGAAAAEDDDEWEGTDDDASDALSDVSSDDDEVNERGVSIRQESIFDRIAALKDIVPPSTRRSIAHSFRTFSQYTFFSGRLFGNVVWVVTTSALLVGLPLMLAIEDEHRVVAQEKELMAQQQGAQHMLAPPSFGGQEQGQQAQGQQHGAPQGLRPPGF